MDLVAAHPIPERLREPLRAALRGENAGWPRPLADAEVRALVAHGVAPLVYRVTGLPELRDEAVRAAAIEALRAADLRSVLDGLLRAGVEALVLKGSALAYGLYAAPELRPRADTDLLVRREDVERVRATLLAAGFGELGSSGDEHGVRQALFTRRDRHGIDHAYDVHWDVSNAPAFSAALSHAEARRQAVPLERLGGGALGLARPDALLLACIHRVSHHHDSERLIWLADIALLRDAMTPDEHRRFWERAAAHRLVGICARSVELADYWLSRRPANGPESFLEPEQIERAEPSRAFLDREIRYGSVLLANLRALPWRARIERLWQLAFPPAAYVRGDSGSRAPLAWRYAMRGVRGIRRLFGRAASPRP